MEVREVLGAVLGAGTMGVGTAVTVARAGHLVLLANVSQEDSGAGAGAYLPESVRTRSNPGTAPRYDTTA
ncbi:3-hydroxyacyl-CoA dehydrogenase NAD-binding domain-containing protein [Nocardia sp. NPDC004260]